MATRTKAEPRIIVLAWTVEEMVHDGKSYARDLGQRPGMRKQTVGRAATWLLRGTPADVRKAKEHAALENAKLEKSGERDRGPMVVFVYPVAEAEPLERARREAVAKASTKK